MKKEGYKTSEFWMSFAAILVGMMLSSGAVSNSLALQVLGGAATMLTALGYQVSRSYVKSSETRSAALVEAAKGGVEKKSPSE